jgi:hypothetical protein
VWVWIWLRGDDDNNRSYWMFPRHSDGEDVARELPHLDALLRLDGDSCKTLGLDLGLVNFLIFKN